MSGPACPTIAPCSQPSTPLRAAFGGGLRPALTAAARGALRKSGRDGETAPSRTKKHHCSSGSVILQNLTHITIAANRRRWWRNGGMLLSAVLNLKWADRLGVPRLP